VVSIFEQGLLLSIAAMGVYISFRIVDLPDLTPDGSYVLGAAVAVTLLRSGHGWVYSLMFAVAASALAGAVTAFITTRFRVNSLLASIMVMTGLYSISIRVMKAPNLPIPRFDTGTVMNYEQMAGRTPLDDLLGNTATSYQSSGAKAISIPFNGVSDGRDLLIITLFAVGVLLIMWIFLKTEFGILFRGYGRNRFAVRSLGVNPNLFAYVGLAMGNALAGLSGGLFSMYSGFADVNMGLGIVVICLASVILGEIVLGKFGWLYGMLCPLFGAITYQLLLTVAMKYGYKVGFKPTDMKLLTAVFVVVVIALRRFKKSEVAT